MLTLQPVDSSSIDLAGYDDEAERLYVRFRDTGEAYVYLNVPRDVFDDFMDADSKGRYLNSIIKGRFDYRQLRRLPSRRAG